MPDCGIYRVEIYCKDIIFIPQEKTDLRIALQKVVCHVGVDWLYTLEKIVIGNTSLNFSNISKQNFAAEVWEKDHDTSKVAGRAANRIFKLLEEGEGEPEGKKHCSGKKKIYIYYL